MARHFSRSDRARVVNVWGKAWHRAKKEKPWTCRTHIISPCPSRISNRLHSIKWISDVVTDINTYIYIYIFADFELRMLRLENLQAPGLGKTAMLAEFARFCIYPGTTRDDSGRLGTVALTFFVWNVWTIFGQIWRSLGLSPEGVLNASRKIEHSLHQMPNVFWSSAFLFFRAALQLISNLSQQIDMSLSTGIV